MYAVAGVSLVGFLSLFLRKLVPPYLNNIIVHTRYNTIR
jgi:hypothetical protein